MMLYPTSITTIQLSNTSFNLYIPDITVVKKQYQAQLNANAAIPFPYWAQIWPSAVALAQFLINHPPYISQKNILELAAGLGLPSLVAAPFAANVLCTDYLPQPLAVVEQSIRHHQLSNMQCAIANWYALPDNLSADVVLLSDVNYEPAAFEALLVVLQRFLQQGATIILSTPQRLVAKAFVAQLLEWATHHETMEINDTAISLLVLEKKHATTE